MLAVTRHWMGVFVLTDLVRDMLDRGANVNVQDDGGRTVWGVCVDKQNEEALALLHERGHSFWTSGMALDPARFQHETYGPFGWDPAGTEPKPVWREKEKIPEVILPYLKAGLQPEDPNDHPDRKGREVHLGRFGDILLIDPPKGQLPWSNPNSATGGWKDDPDTRPPKPPLSDPPSGPAGVST